MIKSNQNFFNGLLILCDMIVVAGTRALESAAAATKKTPIIVKCTEDSPHKALVDVLDICYRNELFSVSIFTL